jgi:hypothetical protein
LKGVLLLLDFSILFFQRSLSLLHLPLEVFDVLDVVIFRVHTAAQGVIGQRFVQAPQQGAVPLGQIFLFDVQEMAVGGAAGLIEQGQQ